MEADADLLIDCTRTQVALLVEPHIHRNLQIAFVVFFFEVNCRPNTNLLIGLRAQTMLTYCNQGRIVWNWSGYTNSESAEL